MWSWTRSLCGCLDLWGPAAKRLLPGLHPAALQHIERQIRGCYLCSARVWPLSTIHSQSTIASDPQSSSLATSTSFAKVATTQPLTPYLSRCSISIHTSQDGKLSIRFSQPDTHAGQSQEQRLHTFACASARITDWWCKLTDHDGSFFCLCDSAPTTTCAHLRVPACPVRLTARR